MDEVQFAVHPRLMDVRLFKTEEEAEEFSMQTKGSSAVGHGSKGAYVGTPTVPVEAIAYGIDTACRKLNLAVDLGFEWIPGLTWGQCH